MSFRDWWCLVVAFMCVWILSWLFGCAKLHSKEKTWTAKQLTVTATGYCPCTICCGASADGITATGRSASLKGIAADPKHITLGSRIDVPDYDTWCLVDDVGGKVKGNHIDLRFKTHEEAMQWGKKKITVRLWVED